MTGHKHRDEHGNEHQQRHLARGRRFGRSGYAALALFASTVGLWAATAQLSGAVIAPAVFVSENNVRKIQHPTGGIIAEILVKEGDAVRAGDLLLRMDDTLARANLQILARQLDETAARVARLQAERDDGAAPAYPPELMARSLNNRAIEQLTTAETRVFEARAAAHRSATAQLTKRIAQLQNEIIGLSGQLNARTREAELNARELENIRSLFRRSLVPVTRLSQLEREASTLEGQRNMLTAQVAQTEAKIAETELQLIQQAQDRRGEVLRELRDAEARSLELLERHATALDQFRRMELRAPASGYVHELSVHTVSGVANAAEQLMLIVPSDERLHLEARVSPADYDQIRLGQQSVVRIHAFNQRTTPELEGVVSRLAADVSRDHQGGSFYSIRVALPPEQLARLAPLQIKAGMQADVFMVTGSRSPTSYLVKPLMDQFARAFRER
jgi:HlyD family secretion protein